MPQSQYFEATTRTTKTTKTAFRKQPPDLNHSLSALRLSLSLSLYLADLCKYIKAAGRCPPRLLSSSCKISRCTKPLQMPPGSAPVSLSTTYQRAQHTGRERKKLGCSFFGYSWKLPAYSGAFLLTVDNFSFFTYNWSFFAYSFSFSAYSWSFSAYSGKVRLIRALRDCKQRSLTVSKKAPTVSKKASPQKLGANKEHKLFLPPFDHGLSQGQAGLVPETSWTCPRDTLGFQCASKEKTTVSPKDNLGLSLGHIGLVPETNRGSSHSKGSLESLKSLNSLGYGRSLLCLGDLF